MVTTVATISLVVWTKFVEQMKYSMKIGGSRNSGGGVQGHRGVSGGGVTAERL